MRKVTSRGNINGETGEEPRASHNILRAAKVICQSGEYPCLIRDVSSHDVKLRFFHKVVPEQRIILEQGNGDTWPVERSWAKGNEAAYRFANKIDVASFLAEPSPFAERAIRLRVKRPAMAALDGELYQTILMDISASGARLESDHELPVHSLVRVAIEDFPMRYGHICWRKGNQHGINFQGTIPLDEFAQHILKIQPFRTSDAKTGIRNWAVRAA